MTTEKLGKELSGEGYWEVEADGYMRALENSYHTHRLDVAWSLIKPWIREGQLIHDFGCGDGVLFPRFVAHGARVQGLDINADMIAAAKKRLKALKLPENSVAIGGVDKLAAIPAESLDAIVSFNVLAYLSDEEIAAFYREARRALKRGGHLVVSHSNELFDMYTLNAYTVDFFRKNFLGKSSSSKRIGELLSKPTAPANRINYNVRANPLSYRHELQEKGFNEVAQAFSHFHPEPPLLAGAEKTFQDTLNIAEADRWKLQFMCSTYMSHSQRV